MSQIRSSHLDGFFNVVATALRINLIRIMIRCRLFIEQLPNSLKLLKGSTSIILPFQLVSPADLAP